MVLKFQDEHGQAGEVAADLTMDYDGYWKDEINRCLNQLVADLDAEDGTADTDAIIHELLIELPERAPITQVERRE